MFHYKNLNRERPNAHLSAAPDAGVTLVEAILALAILGIGIFVLIETTARCLAVIRTSKSYQTAREVLDRGELDHPITTTNTAEDNIVSPVEYHDGFVFSRDIELVEGETELYIVKTKVKWSESGQSSFEEVVGYLYCPEKEGLE
jgi:hypothetical protein